MPTAAPCPLTPNWRPFLLGQLPVPVAEVLGQHLQGCEHCLAEVARLEADDSLVLDLQALRAAQASQAGVVEDLVGRLQRPPAADAPAPAGDATSLTADDLTPPAPPGPAPDEEELTIPGYEVFGELGRGGMGVIYKARQTGLNRYVALKVIRAGVGTDQERRQRFRIEAEAVARLQHPNIVQVFDTGEHQGCPYIVLEYVEGRNLAQKFGDAPQPPPQAAAMVEVLARAIQYAHDQGVLHRDLKPGNVLVRSDGVLKITDFGLAKLLDACGPTQSFAVLGSPGYMTPEQALGKAREVGPAADVWALGAILYNLLTGRPPFHAENLRATLEQICSREPVAPSELQPRVPRDLEAVCLKCLRKEAGERYASAGALAEALQQFLKDQSPGLAPASPGPPAQGPPAAADEAISVEQFLKHLTRSGLLSAEEVQACVAEVPGPRRADVRALAWELVERQKLTPYQAAMLLQGKPRALVLGNYVVLDRLGRDTTRMVFKARHRRLGRVVALKVLSPAVVTNPTALGRFQREAKAGARLSHPNIVATYDADEAKGVHFLVMEHVEGTDLFALVQNHGPLPVGQAVSFVLQAARGLRHAHQAGVVHRDVKPAKLILDSLGGTVKVLDMGLARLEGPEEAAVGGDGLTVPGTIIGTGDYMAPEQALGTGAADRRADIYSLGCTLYYLLAGAVPYAGGTLLERLRAHQQGPAPPLPHVSTRLQAVYARMVAKSVTDRYQSLDEVIADLEACAAGPVARDVPARASGPPPAAGSEEEFRSVVAAIRAAGRRSPGEWLGRWRQEAVVVIFIVLMVLFWLTVALLLQSRPNRPAQGGHYPARLLPTGSYSPVRRSASSPRLHPRILSRARPMPTTTPCPPASDWMTFLLGRHPTGRAEELEQHLLSCRHCLAGTTQLEADSTLLRQLDTLRRAPAADPSLVVDLVRQLRQRSATRAPSA